MPTLRAPWWPDGMNDSEAIEALRGLLVAQIKLIKPSAREEREYEHLRSSLIDHPSYSAFIPSLVRSCPTLHLVTTKLRLAGKTYNARTSFIMKEFDKLIAEAARLAYRQNDEENDRNLDHPKDSPNDRTEPPHRQIVVGESRFRSSAWTGNGTTGEQAKLVLSIAPAAIDGLKNLIADEERRRHNLPAEMIDQEDQDCLKALKLLHLELGTLIQLAEAGSPLDQKVGVIKDLAGRLFVWSKDTARISVAGIQPLAASTPVVVGVWTLLSAICEPTVMQTIGNALVASIPASYIGAAAGRGELIGRSSKS